MIKIPKNSPEPLESYHIFYNTVLHMIATEKIASKLGIDFPAKMTCVSSIYLPPIEMHLQYFHFH